MFANPEDAKRTKGKVRYDENRVERVRRAHQNDLENILPYFFISALYLLTNPNPATALTCFRAFTAARFLHSFVYLWEVIKRTGKAIEAFDLILYPSRFPSPRGL